MCEGGGQGEGGAGVVQFIRNFIRFASEKKVFDRFCLLAGLTEAVRVAMDLVQVGVQPTFSQPEARNFCFFIFVFFCFFFGISPQILICSRLSA